MNLFLSIKYPGMNSPGGWWHKDIHPVAAFVILTIIMLIVFVIGALFTREYIRIWNEITREETQISPVEKIFLP